MSKHAIIVVAALSACFDPPVGNGAVDGPTLDSHDHGAVLPFDHPPVSGGTGGGGSASTDPQSSHPQRLSVMQLRNSLPVVLGNDSAGAPVTWKIGTAVGFDARSTTLGEADYLVRVDEDLEPSPLYLKFMFDMAKDSCNRALTADAAKPQAQRALTRFVSMTDTVQSAPAKIDDNLKALRLQFHGVKVTDDAQIAPYRKLFDDVTRASNVTEGWRTVCVALLTAPEYHLY